MTEQLHFLSHASKVMLKNLHGSLHHCLNQELPDFQTGLRKGRGTRDQIPNISWIIEKDSRYNQLNSPILVDFSSLIRKMSMFTFAISSLTTSNLP